MIFDMEKPKGREGYNLLIGLVAPRAHCFGDEHERGRQAERCALQLL